jgi:hypothetical protein
LLCFRAKPPPKTSTIVYKKASAAGARKDTTKR